MSEQTETVEKRPPPAKPKPQKQGSGSSGAFLATVIALAACGGSYYVWQQHLVAEQDRIALEQSIEQLLKVVEQKDQAQQSRIEQLRAHSHDSVDQRVTALEQTLPNLSQQLTLQQHNWDLAEVDYLLRLAENRLQLNRDIPTAIAALTQARDQLIRYTAGNFTKMVDNIEEHIEILAGLEQHNLSQITTRLGSVIAELETLPFAAQAERIKNTRQPPAPLAEDAKTGERLKYWGRMMWHDIKSLVTIRRSDEINRPLMNPEQRYLLQAQLRLKLETARLAAMGHNQPLYLASLSEAASWLKRYYDGSDAKVVASQATLNELAAITVDPELPSLQTLRQQLHAARPVAAPIAPQLEIETPQQPFLQPPFKTAPVDGLESSPPTVAEEPAVESRP